MSFMPVLYRSGIGIDPDEVNIRLNKINITEETVFTEVFFVKLKY
jgi:hypothetical protein